MMRTFPAIVLVVLAAMLCGPSGCVGSDALFPTDAPMSRFTAFRAHGYSSPACGVVYRLRNTVTNGMPLGGMGTGCLDLETSGLIGYMTIFNTHVPRRGPENIPLLGLSIGRKTWSLCHRQPKKGVGPWQDGPMARPVIPVPESVPLEGVETAREIHYWGHYPIADLEFETSAPVKVGMRAWSPFLPGDVKASMIPAVVFEVHLRNPGRDAQKGTVAFSFPGPTLKEAGSDKLARRHVQGAFTGVVVSGKLASYALGAIGGEKPRLGAGLGADGSAWSTIADSLPAETATEPGASAAVDFSLGPGQSKVVRYVLTWHAPTWNGGGYNWAEKGNWEGKPSVLTHMYARHYPDPLSTARMMARDHASLLARVIAWQQVIYTERALPLWLRESLVNILHLFTETAMWAQKTPPLPGWVREEDGLFGMNECPRECSQIECIPCSFYGSIPLVYFFPELALSTLRGYKGYQDAEGAPPWIFGGQTGNTPPIDFAYPTRGYQVSLNGCCYVDMFDRYAMCRPDRKVLAEFWPSIRKAVEFTVNLNRGADGIVSMPDRKVSIGGMPWESQWFEWYEWYGMVPHVGGIRLAMLRMAERMAVTMGDDEFAARCREWLRKGQDSMESKLWAGSYYLNWWDPDGKGKSDVVFAYQLDGEWMARSHGLQGVFRPDRVKTTLDTIKRYNVAATRYGAINYTHADGTVLSKGESPMKGDYAPHDFFSPELLMLAMTYMYEDQRELGVELARLCWNNIVCEQGVTWDMPNIVDGATGRRMFGADYYQNLMLWALPAALGGQDISGPLKTGGLVTRVIRAARAEM